MKHLIYFRENSSDFNLDLRLSKIKDKYSNKEVEKMFDDEWPNWVDLNWDEDDNYNSDWEWYVDVVGDVAQSVILDIIIGDDTITNEQRDLLESKLIEIYPVLAPL